MQNTAPENNPNVTPLPQTSTPDNQIQDDNPNKRNLILLAVGLIVVLLLTAGYFYYSNANKQNNSSIYNQEVQTVTPSPTPTLYQSDPNDASNAALESDTTATTNDLNSIDSSLNSVDESLNDQQTNLQ